MFGCILQNAGILYQDQRKAGTALWKFFVFWRRCIVPLGIFYEEFNVKGDQEGEPNLFLAIYESAQDLQ